MRARAEVTTRHAKAYGKASKKDKGRIPEQVVEVTGEIADLQSVLLKLAKDKT
jgi:hypothetical protein